MKSMILILSVVLLGVAQLATAETNWYSGDERCKPPKDDGTYSVPYDAKDHPGEYPTFAGADKPGWFCGYQREDGVLVQYGNSLTPQQQWLSASAKATADKSAWTTGANKMD